MSNVILFLVVLFGYHRGFERSAYAPGFPLCLGLTGILTFCLHTVGAQIGFLGRFASIAEALLWAIFAVSLVQGMAGAARTEE